MENGEPVGLRQLHEEEVTVDVVGWSWNIKALCVDETSKKRMDWAGWDEADDDDDEHDGDDNTMRKQRTRRRVLGWAVWERERGDSDAAYARIVNSGSRIEEDATEWQKVEEEREESDDEEENTGEAKAADRALGDAALLVANGTCQSLDEALHVLDGQELEKTFHKIDIDASGLVDQNEILLALRGMGLAATEDDVEEMQQRVDEGGRIAEVKAVVKHWRDKDGLTTLGLKESEKKKLQSAEQELMQLLQERDVTHDGQFGLRAYVTMVRLSRQSSKTLPKMMALRNFVLKEAGGHTPGQPLVLKHKQSLPWEVYYDAHKERITSLRRVLWAGNKDMHMRSSLMPDTLAVKNAIGALTATGEIHKMPHIPFSGYAWLSYASEAAQHMHYVERALDANGLYVVDDRETPYFKAYVERCGLFVAVLTDHFQSSAQCRLELMLARRRGKTCIFLMLEQFPIREAWLAHMLGIAPRSPTYVESLPSCGTWLKSARSVRTTYRAPWSQNRKPPVSTFTDTFDYFVCGDGTPAQRNLVVKVADIGWVSLVGAPLPTVMQATKLRQDFLGEVLQGVLVLDFRPAPQLPILEQAYQEALEACTGPAHELEEANQRLQGADMILKQAQQKMYAAEGMVPVLQKEHEKLQEDAARLRSAMNDSAARLKDKEDALARATDDVVIISEEVRELTQEYDALHVQHYDRNSRVDKTAIRLAEAKVNASKAVDAHGRAKAAYEEAHCHAADLSTRLQGLEAAQQDAHARLRAERDRAKISPQTDETVQEFGTQVGKFKRLWHIGMFIGQATFWKCWAKICIYSGKR